MTQSTRYISNKGFELTPYLLLASKRVEVGENDRLEAGLRRMGLRPEKHAGIGSGPGPDVSPDRVHFGWRVHFGKISALVGIADDERVGTLHAVFDAARASCPIDENGGMRRLLYCCPDDAGAAVDPVAQARELFKLSVLLIDLCAASHFYWSPASLWSKADIFRAAVAEMLESGMPPVLQLVAFPCNVADGSAHSRGLAHFCGQELILRAQDRLSPVESIRRLARLALDMMLNGRIAAPRRFPGLVSGELLALDPLPVNRAADDEWQNVEVRIIVA